MSEKLSGRVPVEFKFERVGPVGDVIDTHSLIIDSSLGKIDTMVHDRFILSFLNKKYEISTSGWSTPEIYLKEIK